MKRKIALAFFVAAATVSFFACQKSDMDNSGPSTLGVKFEALNTSYSLPVSGTDSKSALIDSAAIAWDSAHLVVSKIKFSAELRSMVTHSDSIEIIYNWTGPGFANLLKPDVTFGDFLLQPGFYDEIELTVKSEKEDAGDIPVFYLHGVYTGTNTTVPVEVIVNEDITFNTEKDSVEITGEGIDVTSYVQVYLDELMADVDPADLDNSQLTDGVIVISANSNSDIYYTIFSNLVKEEVQCTYEHKNEKHKTEKKKDKKQKKDKKDKGGDDDDGDEDDDD